MNVLQSVGALIAGLSLLTTIGCADTTPEAAATRVTAAPTSSSTTAPGKTTTTTASPVPTKPLTTAPPSELLTEITAVYDAAYSDLLAAGESADPTSPSLANHILDPQLTQWRSVLKRLATDGHLIRLTPGSSGWRRIERLVERSPAMIELIVCRLDLEQEVDATTDAVVNEGTRPLRYEETFTRSGEDWKWSKRVWIDKSKKASDCAPE